MPKRKWTNEELELYRKSHGAFFYCNKEDSNFLIPKAYGIGATLNWGNPLSWAFIAAIIVLIICKILIK